MFPAEVYESERRRCFERWRVLWKSMPGARDGIETAMREELRIMEIDYRAQKRSPKNRVDLHLSHGNRPSEMTRRRDEIVSIRASVLKTDYALMYALLVAQVNLERVMNKRTSDKWRVPKTGGLTIRPKKAGASRDVPMYKSRLLREASAPGSWRKKRWPDGSQPNPD